MKKRRSSQVLSCIIALILILSMVPVVNVSAVTTDIAEVAGTTTSGLEYEISGGKVTITGYTGSATTCTIPSQIEGYPVTSIGESAFYDCTSLTNVTIPSGVTSIGHSAFFGCESLTSITIPSSVTRIVSWAFYDCKSLTSITIPEGVTSIGDGVLGGCESLTSITIPSNVKSIGNSAFSSCKSLTSITIPSSVTSIGNGAFNDCISLTSVTIPSSVTSIGEYAFSNCTSLASITIPSNVTSIGNFAFSSCTSLTSITIPKGVTSIGNGVVSTCTSLTSITVDEDNTVYDSRNDCNAIIETDTNTIIAGCADTVIPKGVTSICEYAFSGCESLTSITIPSSVTSIGNSAFRNCTSLTSITIPSSVTSIGQYAFLECTSLTSITIPDGITSIGFSVFSRCTSLTSITIPSSVTSIGKYAFLNCASLTSITIPSSVTSIENSAFYLCRMLNDVYYSGTQAQWNAIEIGNDNEDLLDAEIHYNFVDSTKPTVSISSTNLVASSQTATLSMSDNVGVVSYYWGTSSSPSSSSFTTISSTTSTSIQKTVSSSGTYYLIAKDAAGNVSSTASITYYKTTLNANGGSVSPTSVLTKSGNTVTLPTPTRSGYSFVGWGTSTTSTSGVTSVTVTSSRTYYAVWTPADTTKPTVSVSSTNLVASSQTVTLSMSDNVGVVSYYWGTSSSPSSSAYTTITSTKSTSIQKTVSSSGTYYLIAKDADGNVSTAATTTFYKTTLNANGGSVSPTSVITKSGNSFTAPTPTRFGYIFKGWSTASTATSGSTTITPNSNTTYYAIWQAPTTLSVNSTNTASISSGGEMKYYSFTPSTSGKHVIYSTATVDTKVYLYDSDGIELDSDDDGGDSTNFRLEYNLTSGTKYYFGVRYYNSSNTGTIPFSFGRVYTVTYNANDGSDAPLTQYKDYGTPITLSTEEPTRSNYTFAGWGTSSTATSASYQPGDSYSSNSNLTLYAIWTYEDTTKPTVSISTTNLSASSQTATLRLSDNVGVVSYYWGTSSSPSSSLFTTISSTTSTSIQKTVSSSGTYYLFAKDAAGNVSIVATITFYKTTLNANGGSVSPTSVLTKSGNSVTLPTPTRSGYIFVGWGTSATSTSGVTSATVTSSRTYYAVWTPADTTKPTVSISSTNLVASSQTVTLSMSDNVGVVSYYWGTSSSPSSSSFTTISSTTSTSIQKTVSSSGTYYLIAKDAAGNVSSTASITYYNTTFDANGGSVSPTSVLTKSGNSFTPPAPTRFGYNFKGWSTSSTATSGSTTITPNSNTTYYAIWQSAYILSDGSTNTADVSVGGEMRYYSFTPSTSGKYVIYSTGSGDPMVTLYNSSGNMLSSDDEDGESNNFRLEYNLTSGTKYYFGVEFYSSSTTGSIPFKFGRVYNITYNANGGSGAPSTQYKDYGTSITLSTEKPTRSNYTFAGWATSSTASSATYQPGDIYSSNSNVTLYAVWKAVADTTKPTVSISTTNLSASSQTATLSLSDNVGVVSYYWGTSSSPSNSSFTTISSTTSTSVQKTVSSSGTYYLIAKDAAGNVSSTASITYYKTTLNANGGSVSPTSVLTKSGNTVTLPTPTRSGYSFVGWGTSSTSTSGVTYITANANKTYYAVWDYIDTTKPTVSVSYTNLATSSQTVTLSMSDNVGVVSYYWGTSSSPSSSSFTTISSTTSTSIQKTVSSSGTYYLIAKDADGNVSTAATITFYKTTLNANGGSVSPTSVLTKSGETVILPTPTRTNYGFAGWGTTSTATSGINALTVYENRTYYAIWSDKDTKNPTVSVRSTNNVDSSQTATLVMSDNIGVVSYYWGKSASPSSSAFISIASATSKSVDVRVYESGTYYLIAKDAEGNSSITAATFYTTTLNANGGTVSPSSILTKSGNTVTLPTPVRNSYKYLGWNVLSTATSGSLSVSVTSNRTYYAVWEYIHTCSFTGEEEIVVDATCTENGSKLVHCTEPSCSKVQTVVIEAYGHSEGEWEVVKPVACLENGLKERRCPDCDHLFESEIIYSTGHSMGEWYVYRKPGFYTQGEERKDCANCDYFDYKFIPETSIGHQCDFTGEEEIVFAATCTESGSKKIYCFEPECGEYILETIESFGHSLGDWQIYKEAKFHEEGEERKTCEHCAYFENRPIPKTSIGHKCKFTGKEEIIVKATCLDDGSKKVFCFETECGEYKEVEVKRTGHNISDWTVYTEVQFHIDGEERKTCANCGFYESRVIPKLSESHTCSFTGRVNVVFEPTCTETGLKKTYCIEPECGKYLTETPEALGHTESEFMVLKDATCTEDGTKQQKCTVCDEILKTEVITAYGHEYNDWTVIKEATDTEAGEKTRECFICHYVESEIVDPLVPPTTTPDEEKTDLGLLGDVNGDGKVNIKDATMIQKAAAKITELTDEENIRANVNSDAKVNVKDATAIQKFVAKIETGYLIGEKIK